MPSINLKDGRDRDAVVKAESTQQGNQVIYVGEDGLPVQMRKVLKGTSNQSYDILLESFGDEDKVAEALVSGDPDLDMEITGQFLRDVSKVFVNSKNEIVHQIKQHEIILDPNGEQKEVRPRKWAEPNVDTDIPLSWTGKLLKKDAALKKFLFVSKLQIIHVNGLTYDFLYGIAKELAEADSMMLLGGGKSGKEPLIFRRGSVPYRGFLEGRVDGDKYILLLHLSNVELKKPEPVIEDSPVVEDSEVQQKKVKVEEVAEAIGKKASNTGAKKKVAKTLEKGKAAKKDDSTVPKKKTAKRTTARKTKAKTEVTKAQ